MPNRLLVVSDMEKCIDCHNNARRGLYCGPCEERRELRKRVGELLTAMPDGPVYDLLFIITEKLGLA